MSGEACSGLLRQSPTVGHRRKGLCSLLVIVGRSRPHTSFPFGGKFWDHHANSSVLTSICSRHWGEVEGRDGNLLISRLD